MKVRFLSDENFNRRILQGLELQYFGIEILTAEQAGMKGRPDPEVLTIARRASRVLLTHDCKTMPRFFADQVLSAEGCSGVILVPQLLPIGQAISLIGTIWEDQEAHQWVNRIERAH